MAVAVIAFNLALTPVNLMFDRLMLQNAAVPAVQAYALIGIHLYAAAVAAGSLIIIARRWKRPTPGRLDFLVLSMGTTHLVLVPAAIVAVNQLSHGAMVVFAIGALFATVLSYERPRTMQACVALCVVAILVAVQAWQGDARVAASVQLNSLLVGVGFAVLYPLYDRTRYQHDAQRIQLEQVLAEKSTLFQAVGHDLRTPLVEIRRVARELSERQGDPQRLAHDLDTVVHRYRLVLDNLTFMEAQDEALMLSNQGPSSLAQAVDDVRGMVADDAHAKRIELSMGVGQTGADDDVLIAADRRVPTTVLHNLVGNGIKFAPPGGQVRVSSDVDATTVTLCVVNSGTPMDTAVMRQINAGQSVEASTGTAGEVGLGLGLVVARKLLAAAGGSLEARTPTGGGTEIRAVLPRYLAVNEDA